MNPKENGRNGFLSQQYGWNPASASQNQNLNPMNQNQIQNQSMNLNLNLNLNQSQNQNHSHYFNNFNMSERTSFVGRANGHWSRYPLNPYEMEIGRVEGDEDSWLSGIPESNMAPELPENERALIPHTSLINQNQSQNRPEPDPEILRQNLLPNPNQIQNRPEPEPEDLLQEPEDPHQSQPEPEREPEPEPEQPQENPLQSQSQNLYRPSTSHPSMVFLQPSVPTFTIPEDPFQHLGEEGEMDQREREAEERFQREEEERRRSEEEEAREREEEELRIREERERERAEREQKEEEERKRKEEEIIKKYKKLEEERLRKEREEEEKRQQFLSSFMALEPPESGAGESFVLMAQDIFRRKVKAEKKAEEERKKKLRFQELSDLKKAKRLSKQPQYLPKPLPEPKKEEEPASFFKVPFSIPVGEKALLQKKRSPGEEEKKPKREGKKEKKKTNPLLEEDPEDEMGNTWKSPQASSKTPRPPQEEPEKEPEKEEEVQEEVLEEVQEEPEPEEEVPPEEPRKIPYFGSDASFEEALMMRHYDFAGARDGAQKKKESRVEEMEKFLEKIWEGVDDARCVARSRVEKEDQESQGPRPKEEKTPVTNLVGDQINWMTEEFFQVNLAARESLRENWWGLIKKFYGEEMELIQKFQTKRAKYEGDLSVPDTPKNSDMRGKLDREFEKRVALLEKKYQDYRGKLMAAWRKEKAKKIKEVADQVLWEAWVLKLEVFQMYVDMNLQKKFN